MKSKHIILTTILTGSLFTACLDLDIPPKNIIGESGIYTDGGITAFMSALYSTLPMEEFTTSNEGDYNGFFNWNCIKWDMISTGETVCRDNTGIFVPQKSYWSMGYKTIRQANSLIQELPAYVGKLSGAPSWIAEARFIRAYVYFAMVKRYGGVPILTEVQQPTENVEELWIARSSHEACVDFILEDLDYAIANLGTAKVPGRANNKYVAAAFKARVALYAGSVAKYGGTFNHNSQTDPSVMLQGLPASRANDYFQQAYEACKVVDEGGYALYNGNSSKEVNFREVFSKADTSPESIFIRQYNKNDFRHSFDVVYSLPRMTSTYGDRYCVTLDWVELFDGIDKDPTTGHIKTTDDQGNYIVYDGPQEIYKTMEPRLLGSLIVPGNVYKTVEVEVRGGIIKEEYDPADPIAKFIADDGQTTTSYNSGCPTWFNSNNANSRIVRYTGNPKSGQTQYVRPSDNQNFNPNGQDGPTNGNMNSTLTGFTGGKWLDLTLTPGDTKIDGSTQSWIDIRYAEVLLTRAEAALELFQNGGSVSGVDLQQDAFECINKVRERGGAVLLASKDQLSDTPRNNARHSGINSFVFAPNEGLHIIRVERYKELAFEHKLYWDLRRWFTFDKQIYQYRRREMIPFLFAKGATVNAAGNAVGKYIYDTRICENANNSLTFDTKNYYDKIPDGERKTNPLLEQNNMY